MKKCMWLLLVCLVILALTVCGCSQPDANQPAPAEEETSADSGDAAEPAVKDVSEMKIAVLMPSLEGYVYIARIYGLCDQAEQLGIPKPTILAAGGYDQLEVQVRQIDDMIAAGVDAIIIMPLSEEGVNAALNRAAEAGIYVIEMGNTSTAEQVQCRIRIDHVELGKMLARHIGEKYPDGANIVCFNGPAGAAWSINETEKGFFVELAQNYPNINILEDRWLVYDASVAMTTMNDFMQAHDDIDHVYACFDTYAEGAAAAIRAAGKEDEIQISCAALSTVSLPLLESGQVDLVIGSGPVFEARNCMEAAKTLIQGGSVEPLTYIDLVPYATDDVNSDSFDPGHEFYPEGWTVPN